MNHKEVSISQKALRPLEQKDYGIVHMDSPEDILYSLTFDKNSRTLMINGKIFMRLKPDLNSEKTFLSLFKKRGSPKRILLAKKEDAYYIIRNLGLPKNLRKAIFNTYSAGKKLKYILKLREYELMNSSLTIRRLWIFSMKKMITITD